ncbi:MAG TPA: phospho-sugar mutase, partial [Chthoniobacterales bacterium]|nr:phospho-sugar mutase [Chthoniobacterales bacterium]
MLQNAVASGRLLPAALTNISELLGDTASDLAGRVVTELVAANAWDELNDRFYRTLAFGTGGLRGRTIGKIVTASERGNAAARECPQFPCVGTNAMNFVTLARAARGLITYLHDWNRKSGIIDRPKLVIACDSRYFSTEFSALVAQIAAENGVDAFVFDGPRSTPELSFAVRYLRASAGAVITASHNPPHDNGFKVYFDDGAQVIEPHASGIIAQVNAAPFAGKAAVPVEQRGRVTTIGHEIDEAYMRRLETLVLDRTLIAQAKALRVVFTPIHGTGGVIIKPMLQRLGFN